MFSQTLYKCLYVTVFRTGAKLSWALWSRDTSAPVLYLCRTVLMPKYLVTAYGTLCLLDSSPTVWSFAYWTLRLLVILPTTWTVCLQIAHFANKTTRIKSNV